MANLPEKIHFSAILADRDPEDPKGMQHIAKMFEGPFPDAGPDDVVVKMKACNICTTDYQQWMGLREHQGFPMAGGHEFSGEVYWTGENVRGIEIGWQVAVCNVPYCGECHNCRKGETYVCTNRPTRKADDDSFKGGKCFADYAVFDKKYIFHIDESVSPAEAGLLEPISTVVHGIKKLRVAPLEDVVVIGAGTMGMLNAQVAKVWGANVFITEIDQKKLDQARKVDGITVIDAKANDPVAEVKRLTGGRGADAVIVAVGLSIAYKQAYDMLKAARGRILVFPAGYPKPVFPEALDPNNVHYKEIEIIGTFASDLADWEDAATLLSKHMIEAQYSLEGVTIPLCRIQEAYKAAATPGSFRVSVDLQGTEE